MTLQVTPFGSVSVSILRRVYRPTVASEAELRRYAFSVTLFAGSVALAIDVVNHLVFFAGWAECLRDWAIDAVAVVGVAYPISRSIGRAHLELYEAKREAEKLSRLEPMTGLANRRAFYEAAERLGSAAELLVIVDIDRFKRINDEYGHLVGDEVIKAVAARMQAELGDLGMVARLGGEEFALVGPARPAEEIRARLQRLRQGLAEAPVAGVRMTVSAGFAARGGLGFEALYAAADKALYVAKSAGRDRVVEAGEIAEIAPVAAAALRAG